jgi:acetylornithine deacetylase/succinyl-diaminopimelate desuccinylase-like protein
MSDNNNLHDLLAFLRFPSISTNPDNEGDLRACAGWLANHLSSIGLHSEVVPTGGHPVVMARSELKAGRKTVLIYGHYDVQPVDPLHQWKTAPFEPHVHDGIIYARGATDNKGQIMAHIQGVRQSLERDGDLPVNVIFLIEGEEEIGSPHLTDFLEKQRKNLEADVVLISDTGMIAPGVPTFTYGLRGVACLEFTIHGPSHDLHSGIFGGAIPNPAAVMSRLLASLHDRDGKIAIEGFYDSVREAEAWESEAWAQLPVEEQEFLDLTESPGLFGEKGYNSFERSWARPTAEINGVYSGYQGKGSKTIIPAEATAKLSFRIVPDQDCHHILDLAESHLRKHCPDYVRMDVRRQHSGNPYLVNPKSGFGGAATEAMKQAFPNAEPALIREGGSIPIVSEFKRVLGLDTLLLGLALPDARCHSPNENFPIANYEGGMRLNQAFLEQMAKGLSIF